MKTMRHLVAIIVLALMMARAWSAESIHFLVPGGAGGGWDATARGVGMVLRSSKLIESASFENISGAGGGRAIGALIESAARNRDELMVNSTPIIVRSLSGAFPFSYHDLTPVARVIGDYQVLAVRADSDVQAFTDVLRRFRSNPRDVKIAGGSVRGDLDHLAPAMIFQAAGENPRDIIYVPYDAGGRAIAGFLTGEADILSSGFGEALPYHNSGKIRIVAITAPHRIGAAPDVPTLVEQGVDFEFMNWRGFFAAPGIADSKADYYAELLEQMQATEDWQVLRDRNGWQDQYLDRSGFTTFLANQEVLIRELMVDMGFFGAVSE